MFKIIGAVMIAASAAAIGMMSVFKLRQRVRSLASLTSALGAVRSEVCDRLTPIPELLEQMAQEASYPANRLFANASAKMFELGDKPFSVIWLESVKATPELTLNDTEVQVLKELGTGMGRYNADEQRGAFTYAQRRFEEFLHTAEAARDTNSKMHAFLGVSAGLLAVIILI